MTGEEGALRRNAGEMMWMGSRLRFHEGRLFAGTTEGGMGPRIREDKEGEGGSRSAPTDWVMGSLYFR